MYSCYNFIECFNQVYCDVVQASYSLKCPERPQWKTRADSKCNGIADKYHCLYDKNNENITEFCASPKDYTAGKQFIGIFIDFVTRIKVNKKTYGRNRQMVVNNPICSIRYSKDVGTLQQQCSNF